MIYYKTKALPLIAFEWFSWCSLLFYSASSEGEKVQYLAKYWIREYSSCTFLYPRGKSFQKILLSLKSRIDSWDCLKKEQKLIFQSNCDVDYNIANGCSGKLSSMRHARQVFGRIVFLDSLMQTPLYNFSVYLFAYVRQESVCYLDSCNSTVFFCRKDNVSDGHTIKTWNSLTYFVICRSSYSFLIQRSYVKSSKTCRQDIFKISKS